MEQVIKGRKNSIRIGARSSEDEYVTVRDIEMDKRAKQAVKAAVSKAEVCNKPVAKYDKVQKKAYLEYPDGRIVDV